MQDHGSPFSANGAVTPAPMPGIYDGQANSYGPEPAFQPSDVSSWRSTLCPAGQAAADSLAMVAPNPNLAPPETRESSQKVFCPVAVPPQAHCTVPRKYQGTGPNSSCGFVGCPTGTRWLGASGSLMPPFSCQYVPGALNTNGWSDVPKSNTQVSFSCG